MPCKGQTKQGKPCKWKTTADFCPAHMPQDGEGIISDAYDKAKGFAKKVAAPITRRVNAIREGPAAKPTSRLQAFLDKTSDKPIVRIQLGRKPIVSGVKKAMDALSLGKFSKKAKELKYDDVYHQYTIFTLADGSQYKLEKNHVVEYFPATKEDFKHVIGDIPLKAKILTMKEMVDTASKDDPTSFWKYRAGSNNCQRFTRDLVEKNELMPEYRTTILDLQDAKQLADTLPAATHGVPNLITDVAAVGDRLVHGDGVQDMRQIRAMLFSH